MERFQTSEKGAPIPRKSQKQRKSDAGKFNVSEEKKSAIPSDPGKKRVRWADKYNGSLNEIRSYTLSADEITEKKSRPAAFTYDSRTLTLEDVNTLIVGAQDDLDAVRAFDDAENCCLLSKMRED